MKAGLFALAPLVLAILASPIPADAQAGKTISGPTWLQTPDRATIDRHFPEAARSSRMPGVAMLRCAVVSDGWLENCAVATESPTGLGFGQAALELSTFFRVKVDGTDGSPPGSLVAVPISLPLPADSGPSSIPAPPPAPWQLPPGARVSIITPPSWRTLPSTKDLIRAYPKPALKARVEGRGVVECLVKTTGRLQNCSVVEETPPGFGFGDAAIKMASSFEFNPLAKDGKPVDGGQIKIPITFKLPSAPPPPPPAP